jgi:hypothetical protein
MYYGYRTDTSTNMNDISINIFSATSRMKRIISAPFTSQILHCSQIKFSENFKEVNFRDPQNQQQFVQ